MAFLPLAERYFILLVFGYSALCAKNRTQLIVAYHAAAGKICFKREPLRKSWIVEDDHIIEDEHPSLKSFCAGAWECAYQCTDGDMWLRSAQISM